MKHLLKLWTLSLALIATIFVLNTTKAANGDLTLQITGTSGYCVYGQNLDLWSHAFSYNARTISGQFLTTGGASTWYCVDSYGVASWSLTIQSSNVANITTNNPVHTIPNTSVKVKNPSATLVNGTCSIHSGESQGNYIPINSAKILFGKLSAVGEACEISTANVRLSVDLTWSQAIGQYSGTLTINVPSL